jgi:hypothetical protein
VNRKIIEMAEEYSTPLPDADPQSDAVHVDVRANEGEGALTVDFSKDRLDAMSPEEKRDVARALAGMVIGRELSPKEMEDLERVRPTIAAQHEDGGAERFTFMGGGQAAHEHTPGGDQ